MDTPFEYPPLVSATINIDTARSDAVSALDSLDSDDYENAVIWLNNAIAQLESARAKISAHAASLGG